MISHGYSQHHRLKASQDALFGGTRANTNPPHLRFA
jgi:hypothetical protein